jgi:hypothetical protein
MKSDNPEFDGFARLVDRVLTIPREELDRRKEYRRQVDQNPKRRGPKRKPKASADGHESRDEG